MIELQWHPVRPMIASISSGVVSVWAQNQVENWSAFAPDFKELDENVEYEERESEFDISDEDKSVELGPEKQEDDLEVTKLLYIRVQNCPIEANFKCKLYQFILYYTLRCKRIEPPIKNYLIAKYFKNVYK